MIVGLTGGIGSGKSTVARLFELLGCAVFSSDNTAKEIYYDPRVRINIMNLLGQKSYRSNGKINKSYISTKIFSDSALLHELNGIIHPAVKEKMHEFVEEHPDQIIVKETALLFEANLQHDVNKIVLVAARDELRLKRVMLRDNLTEWEVQLRIKSQLPQEEKIVKSDFVIYNNDEDLVIPQVLTIFEKLKRHQATAEPIDFL